VKIRPATPADVPELARIAAASYRATFLTILGEAGLALRDAAFFEHRFPDEIPCLHIGEDGAGRMLGFHQVKNCLLIMLFLEPALTGRNLGAQLLADAESKGANRLECFSENHGARRFYERHGWHATDPYTREFAGAERDFIAYSKP
jgi:putative acetyltransferase